MTGAKPSLILHIHLHLPPFHQVQVKVKEQESSGLESMVSQSSLGKASA